MWYLCCSISEKIETIINYHQENYTNLQEFWVRTSKSVKKTSSYLFDSICIFGNGIFLFTFSVLLLLRTESSWSFLCFFYYIWRRTVKSWKRGGPSCHLLLATHWYCWVYYRIYTNCNFNISIVNCWFFSYTLVPQDTKLLKFFISFLMVFIDGFCFSGNRVATFLHVLEIME